MVLYICRSALYIKYLVFRTFRYFDLKQDQGLNVQEPRVLLPPCNAFPLGMPVLSSMACLIASVPKRRIAFRTNAILLALVLASKRLKYRPTRSVFGSG